MLLADMNWSQLLLGLLIIGVCFFLVVVILLQRGRGGGLAGAFGGGGGSGTFGAKTGDVFTWITVAFAGVFLLLAIFANFVFDRSAYALDNPAVAEQPPGAAAPTDGAAPSMELITEDGQVLPIGADGKVTFPVGTPPAQPSDKPAAQPGDQPAAQPPPTDPNAAAQPETKPGTPVNPGAATPPAEQPKEQAGEGTAPQPGSGSGQANDNGAPEEPKDPGR